jgi:hypothetical protein
MIAFTHIIHHIYTYIYIFYSVHLLHIFISSGLHGRLAALGSLCPIQVGIVISLHNHIWFTKCIWFGYIDDNGEFCKVSLTAPLMIAVFNTLGHLLNNIGRDLVATVYLD